MNPTLSIITINFNNRDGLQKTIDSVVAQSFRDFEWIVIDGGSTDGSRELLEQYAGHFSYWVSEPDKGIYNAMNKGVKVAKGDYLQFLNSGDWLCDENALARCFSHPLSADIVYGDLFFLNTDDSRERAHYPQEISLHYLFHFSLGHSASFIRRNLLLEQPYDEQYRIVSDWAFFLRQALAGRSFDYLDEVITCFDMTGISTVQEDLVEQERQDVISHEIPEAIIRDMVQMDEMKSILEKNHVKKVLEFGGKNKLYHRMITGVLSIIGFFDRHF